MIQTDIFTIASSGLNVAQGLLNTTSNNISNVNTPGYVRQTGTVQEQDVGGVLLGNVERIVNRFAQEQQLRDTSQLGEAQKLSEKLTQLDTIFASEAISAAEGMSRYFAALQTATDEPNNMAARQTALAQADGMVKQFQRLDDYLENSAAATNEEFDQLTSEANNLIQTIADFNRQIKESQFASQTLGSNAILNQRDEAVKKLSKLVELESIPQTDGSQLLFLKTGQSLVLEDGSFNLFSQIGNPDPQNKELALQVPGNANIKIPLSNADVGGELGGLIRYRDEVLEVNRRELGQISLAFADAMNEQNKLGMDLDGDIGVNLFTMPQFTGLSYNTNFAANSTVNARVPEGNGAQISSADYEIVVDSIAGANMNITINLLNPNGSPLLDNSGNAITQSLTVTPTAGNFVEIPAGTIAGDLELEFPNPIGDYRANDRFLIQPARNAAGDMKLNISRAEDFALAAPVRVNKGPRNLGNGAVSGLTVTNTEIGNADPTQNSAFQTNGTLAAGAPHSIYFTSPNSYEVRDQAGAPIVTVNAAPNLDNVIGQAKAVGGWPFGGQVDYPGYDFSINGTPKAGDSFLIQFNTNGFNDNSNGLKLSGLQGEDKLLQSDAGNGSAITFHEAYATMVNDIGSKTATAQVQLDAAVATERLSTDWVNSVSGVSLDEEAANLIRFQQAYSASARVLSTAQSLFQTILSAIG